MVELMVALVGMYLVVAIAGVWMRAKRRRLSPAESVMDRGGID